MHPALWISKTGLDAQQTDIAVLSNNLANASTVGFKKSRAVFEDLLYQTVNQPGGQSSQNTRLPSGLMLGAGTKVVASQKIHTQGNPITTGDSMDWTIRGRGFFQVQMPDGTVAYTRNGQFTLNEEGQLVTSGAGYLVQPQIDVPPDAQSLTVSTDGQVSVKQPGQAEATIIGNVTTVDFVNPSGLMPIGENLFTETGASGAATEGTPGLDGLGTIRQGELEASNVNVTEELVNLIQAQRVYEMNAKVISAVDQMLSYVNQQL